MVSIAVFQLLHRILPSHTHSQVMVYQPHGGSSRAFDDGHLRRHSLDQLKWSFGIVLPVHAAPLEPRSKVDPTKGGRRRQWWPSQSRSTKRKYIKAWSIQPEVISHVKDKLIGPMLRFLTRLRKLRASYLENLVPNRLNH